MGINNHEKRSKRREDGPAEHAVSHPGEQGQAGHVLCDSDGERIQEGGGKADVGRHIHDEHAHQGIIPHGHHQRNHDPHERNRLLAHAENRSGEGEQDGDGDEHPLVPPANPGDEAADACRDGSRRIEQPEGPANDEDEDDDPRLLDEPVIDG